MSVWHSAHETLMDRVGSTPGLWQSVAERWDHAAQFAAFAFQKPRGRPTMAEKLVTTELVAGLASGAVGVAFIRLPDTPFPDADCENNQAVLDEAEGPFVATLERDIDFGGMIADGFVEWRVPAPFLFAGGMRLVQPAGVPLEVGYMPCGKMAYALSGFGAGIARWPYGQDRLMIFVPGASL